MENAQVGCGERSTTALKARTKMPWRYAAIIAGIAAVGVIVFLVREPILLAVGNFLVVQEDLQPADVIHVISGPDYRSDYGDELYRQGYAKQMFFTGGWCPVIQGNHALRAEERALEQGIPATAIVADGFQVTSTYSEAVRLKMFIDQSPVPIRSVIIVSDPHHMRRARWAYHEVLGDGVKLEMAPVPFQQSPYRRRWWTDDESRQMVKDEYLKLARITTSGTA